IWGGGKRRDDGADHSRRDKRHPQKQQTAAKENGGEKEILALAKPVAQYPDKPKKRHPGKGNQVQRQCHRARTGVEPCARFSWVSRHGSTQQPKGAKHRERKQDSGKCGSPWRSQAGARERLVPGHVSPVSSFNRR